MSELVDQYPPPYSIAERGDEDYPIEEFETLTYAIEGARELSTKAGYRGSIITLTRWEVYSDARRDSPRVIALVADGIVYRAAD